MAKREAFIVVGISIFVHLIITLNIPSYLFSNIDPSYIAVEINVSIGIFLLLFPLFGFLADVFITRYRMIQLSVLFTIVALILGLIISTLCIIIMDAEFIHEQSEPQRQIAIPISMGIIMTCIGIFEANAIQFGLDQLLEASSTQLSAFIHWYFWSVHLGQEVFFYIISIIEYAIFFFTVITRIQPFNANFGGIYFIPYNKFGVDE